MGAKPDSPASEPPAADPLAGVAWYRKLIYAFVPLFVLVFLVEGAFRLIPRRHRYHETVAGLAEPDPDLIWRLKPHSSGPLKTNSLGLRDDEPDPAADLRVLLLGDSVAWGEGIPRRELVFPQAAEAMASRPGGPRVSIVNAAVLGYSTFQQLRYFELRGPSLKPDLVVLQFCLNDVVERYTSLSSWGGGDLFLGVDTREAIPGLFGSLVRRSRAFEAMARGAVRLTRNWQEYDVRRLARDTLSPELDAAWGKTLAELDGIAGLARARGIPFVLLVAPYRFQLEDHAGLDQPQRRLLDHARASGIRVVDMLPIFAALRRAEPDVDLYIDENHFSEAGHEVAARILAEAIMQHGPR